MRPAEATRRAGRLWPGAVVVATIAAALLGAPDPVLGVGVVVSVVLAAERVARWRGRDLVDAGVLAAGGLLVGLVLVGLALGSTPLGLGARSWAASLGIGALAVLLTSARSPRPQEAGAAVRSGDRWGDLLRAAPWVIATLAVVGLALSASASTSVSASTPATSVTSTAPPQPDQPPLAMSLGAVSGTDVDVVVTAGSAAATAGPFALRVVVGTAEITYPVFTPTAGRPYTSRVTLPATGRFVVDLLDVGKGTVVRSLTLSR